MATKAQLEGVIKALQSEREELQTQLAAARERVATRDFRIEQLSDLVEQLQADDVANAEYEDQIAGLIGELDAAKDRIEELENSEDDELTQLREDKSRLLGMLCMMSEHEYALDRSSMAVVLGLPRVTK